MLRLCTTPITLILGIENHTFLDPPSFKLAYTQTADDDFEGRGQTRVEGRGQTRVRAGAEDQISVVSETSETPTANSGAIPKKRKFKTLPIIAKLLRQERSSLLNPECMPQSEED